MAELNSVQKFYKGKTIFITGASGYMGKVLIEKLLYSCSEIKEIMILMRPKRGKTGLQRVEEFKKIPVSLIFFELVFKVQNLKCAFCSRCSSGSWMKNRKSWTKFIQFMEKLLLQILT